MITVRKPVQLSGTVRPEKHECDDPSIQGTLPRIVRLMALAIRFEDCQSAAMIAGLKQILLVEIQEVLLGQQPLHITLKSQAIFEAFREHNKGLTSSGRLVSAKFKVCSIEGDYVIVTIFSGNKIRFSRQVGIEAIIAWLLHHGIRTTRNASKRNSAAALANNLAHPKSTSPKVPLVRRTG